MNNMEKAKRILWCNFGYANLGLHSAILSVIRLIDDELDRQREARSEVIMEVHRADFLVSMKRDVEYFKGRADGINFALQYFLEVAPQTVSSDPLRLWREMGAW